MYDEGQEQEQYYEEMAKLMAKPEPTGPDYVTISTRSRNLAVTWTNSAVQRYGSGGQGYLAVKAPSAPTSWGGVKSCEEELARAKRINNSNDWRSRLWVGNRYVVGLVVGQALFNDGITFILGALRERGTITVKLAPAEGES